MSVRLIRCVTFSLFVLTGCAALQPVPVPAPEAELPAPFAATHQAVLRCPDLAAVSLLLNDNAARIDAAGGPHDMLRVMSASGVLYEAGGSELWIMGDNAGDFMAPEFKASYREPGEDAGRECSVVMVGNAWESAALRDVSLRALGQEPGWLLEVVPDKWLLLLLANGGQRIVLPPVLAVPEGAAQRFSTTTDSHVLDVLATPLPCADNMSGEAFDTQVSVTLDGRTLQGCGRWLDK